MPILQKQRQRQRCRLLYIPVEDIVPNPVQPRREFDPEGISQLAGSIRDYGVLNPLTVREKKDKYELIAGERRLRAAKEAGLRLVPCVIMDLSLEDSGVIALIENLQRRDLDFIEEAEGISHLIQMFGLSQEEVARRLGKSQSAVANKLRLLRLPSDVLERLRENGLGERYGRALLRLSGSEECRRALDHILCHRLNVAGTDAYVDSLLENEKLPEPVAAAPMKKTVFVLKDVRVFLNSLTHGLDMMKRGGIKADMQTQETDDELILSIKIPKSSGKPSGRKMNS